MATTAAPLTDKPSDPGTVFIGQPSYGFAHPESVRSLYSTATAKHNAIALQTNASLLALSFNSLWCTALNRHRVDPNVQYFAMLHGDVEPDLNWVDTLIDELEAHQADVMATVIPIKNNRGLTSTAISPHPDHPDYRWATEQRLTMHEVMALPETFDAAALGFPDRALLVNTGCWVCRLDRPWTRKVHFEINDKIVEDADGNLEPVVEPEDWNFSRQLFALGAKVMATRKLAALHHGWQKYPNNQAWGDWQTDESCLAADRRKEAEKEGVQP